MVNQPLVVPISLGYGVGVPPIDLPAPLAQVQHCLHKSNLMLPPSLPTARKPLSGPTVYAPAAWASIPALLPSPSHMPSGAPGYSKHHASYTTELARWSGCACGTLPPVETISLSIAAVHEGGQRRGRLNRTPFGVSCPII